MNEQPRKLSVSEKLEATSSCCSKSVQEPVGNEAPNSINQSAAGARATSCCASESELETVSARKKDWILWGSLSTIAVAYLASFFIGHDQHGPLMVFTHTVQEMLHVMWWGILIGMLAVGLIDRVPREMVIAAVGRDRSFTGLLRATAAGFLLDLCNHGVLMVGAKLYERGASLGQTFAFLIASPWNSLSLTIIIGLLMGWGWMFVFIGLSLVIALVTGLIVERMESRGLVAANPNRIDLPEDFDLITEARQGIRNTRYDWDFVTDTLHRSVTASRMVLRWLLFGIVLAALIRAAIPTEIFASWFGPTLFGLFATLAAATLIEVCSEGSVPIASDLMARAGAPGNAFTFLMAGASTDYTEMMVLREVTGYWKSALILPLLTVPQIVALGFVINQF
ncbi:MAG: permease [Pseudomonadota bacterium]